MKRIGCFLLAGLLVLCLAACGQETSSQTDQAAAGEGPALQGEREEETQMEASGFYVTVNGVRFAASFADTAAAQTLRELLAGGDLTLSMQDYGGFEKVGALGQSLPASNSQMTTQAGDIVLYQGDQIVLFYGSNSWSYTRLAKVDDLTGWAEALGRGEVSVVLSLG